MLAQTFIKQGRVDDGIRAARAALEQNPRSAMAHNTLGSAYLVQGKYDQAMTHLDKAIELEPELPQAYIKKGLFNLAAGNLQKGETDLQNAVAVAPTYSTPGYCSPTTTCGCGTSRWRSRPCRKGLELS